MFYQTSNNKINLINNSINNFINNFISNSFPFNVHSFPHQNVNNVNVVYVFLIVSYVK